MLARPAPLRDELAQALPERPFSIEFWDGSRLDATNGSGPTFRVRSPAAVAHALRAPGQLGLGRAQLSRAPRNETTDNPLEPHRERASPNAPRSLLWSHARPRARGSLRL